MRLIDADALIEEYDRVHVGEPGGARKLMMDAPTIEPERKKGKWARFMQNLSDGYQCNRCGHIVRYVSDYCPNCGCQMER